MSTPYCDWSDVPLTCRIGDVARVLNCGVRTIRTWLAEAPWRVPTPEPRLHAKEPLTWRKSELQRFVERGGAAARVPGQARKHFPTAVRRAS